MDAKCMQALAHKDYIMAYGSVFPNCTLNYQELLGNQAKVIIDNLLY